jgi:hypothetical protein
MDTQLDQLKSAPTGHSSNVTMSLHVGSITFPVLQSSKAAIKLKDSHNVPLGDAVLEIIIDGRPRRWPIRVLPTSPRPNWISIVDRC